MFSRFTRRRFLLMVGLFVSTATIAGFSFVDKFFLNKAQAQQSAETYKGRTFTIVNTPVASTSALQPSALQPSTYDQPVQLFLDNKQVNVTRNKKTKRYSTDLLPFGDYNSARALAIDLIDLNVNAPDNLQPN